jgi:hypothetical protein
MHLASGHYCRYAEGNRVFHREAKEEVMVL